MITYEDAQKAKATALKLFAKEYPEVNGVGLIRNKTGYKLKVNLSMPTGRQFPSEIEGLLLEIEYVGDVVAQKIIS